VVEKEDMLVSFVPSHSAQFAIGAGLERQIVGPVALRITAARSHVDPPWGWFNDSPNPYFDLPLPGPVPKGATLYSADIVPIFTAPQLGRGIKPYFFEGAGFDVIHIPGGDTVSETNLEAGLVFGAGLKIPLPQRWELRPELRFLLPFAQSEQPVAGNSRITIGISRTF
jgi:hypothetical protein